MSDCGLKDRWRIGQRSYQVVTVGYASKINDRDGLRREKTQLNNVLFLIPQCVYIVRSHRLKDR
jgi:hypothetical protein